MPALAGLLVPVAACADVLIAVVALLMAVAAGLCLSNLGLIGGTFRAQVVFDSTAPDFAR